MFKFFEDPGHGWLEVPVSMLDLMGIRPKISNFSYRKNDMAYLEEDCDFAVFYDAFVKTYGTPPKYERVYQEVTPIRSYSRFM